MIYFDNAATTAVKPPEVAEAVARAVNSFGGAGRGVHEASLDAGYAVFRARQQLARLLGAGDPSRVAFASNATEALNTAIVGLARPGDKLVTTAASHNSVLRPLYRLADERGCEVVVVPHDARGALDYDALEAALPGARLAAVTHASNLTGDVYDIARIARLCREHGALLVADAAQTAGVVPIDMGRDGLDVVAFTGHKSLYGPPGHGRPRRGGRRGDRAAEGGRLRDAKLRPAPSRAHARAPGGRHAERPRHRRLERGARLYRGARRGGAGRAGARAGRALRARRARHRRRARAGAEAGTRGAAASWRSTWAMRTLRQLATRSTPSCGICTRAGAHCAPLMHEALGTQRQGAVRFSFSSFNTEDEVDAGIAAVAAIAEEA